MPSMPWEQQHNAILSHPLGLSWADELVYDALGRVVEVTKLGLPEDQGIRAGHGKAQLEAQDPVLRELLHTV